MCSLCIFKTFLIAKCVATSLPIIKLPRRGASLWKYTYDLSNLFKGLNMAPKRMVPKKMLTELSFTSQARALRYSLSVIQQGPEKIIPRSDLNLMDWANTSPLHKNGLWLPTVCVTWKTELLSRHCYFEVETISVSNSRKLYPRNRRHAKSNFQHSKD